MKFFEFLSKRNADAARKKAETTAKESKKHSYLLNESTPFAVTEAFRSLKMTLSVSMAKKNDGLGQSFLCTSSYPSEGKTTVAANIALMLAQSNVKVVLVDTDLRAGRISKYFKIPHSPGLYVLYDSPPFRLVSDALAVSPVADGTFLVTRHRFSYQSDIRAALDALRFVKANVLGIVVNDFRPDRFSKKDSRNTRYYSYSYYANEKNEAQSENKADESSAAN